MAYPFNRRPTLRQFIDVATRLGCAVRNQADIRYICRPETPGRFVILPNVPENEPLTPVVLSQFCRTLEIPPEEFGLDIGLLDDPFFSEPP